MLAELFILSSYSCVRSAAGIRLGCPDMKNDDDWKKALITVLATSSAQRLIIATCNTGH